MNNSKLTLPKNKRTTLYQFNNAPGSLFETTSTQTDPTNSTITVLTTTHIWQK